MHTYAVRIKTLHMIMAKKVYERSIKLPDSWYQKHNFRYIRSIVGFHFANNYISRAISRKNFLDHEIDQKVPPWINTCKYILASRILLMPWSECQLIILDMGKGTDCVGRFSYWWFSWLGMRHGMLLSSQYQKNCSRKMRGRGAAAYQIININTNYSGCQCKGAQ